MNPVHTRLLSHQLISPQHSTAADVVRYMGAMQAQDYRMMRLAVKMRTRKPEKALFEEAFNKGEIVRMHLLRMTWQLVPRELALPLVHLCHDRNLRSLRGWTSSFGFNPSEYTLHSTFALLTDCLQDGKSLTNTDLCERLQKAGLAANRQQARYLLHYAEINGIVCNGNLADKDIAYALFSEKVGAGRAITCNGSTVITNSTDDIIATLARAYFRSHAPATFADFVWWSGLTRTDCKRAMSLIGDELTAVELPSTFIKGHKDTYYLHSSTRTRGCKSGTTIQLPAYDEYLIGYKSRHIVLDSQQSHIAHDNKGIFYPVVLQDGIVSKRWH